MLNEREVVIVTLVPIHGRFPQRFVIPRLVLVDLLFVRNVLADIVAILVQKK